jgi:myo-inositol-1(or 4)-monophosphatase
VLPVIGDLRRVPAALNLAYLAVGRTDASVLVDAKLWDVAAGLVIAAEAGAHPGSRAEDLLVLAASPELAAGLMAQITPP